MGRFYFEIRHDKIEWRQMKRDYLYLFGNRILIDGINLLIISSVLWGLYILSRVYWREVWQGALVIIFAILGIAWSLIFLYRMLIPFIVRVLIPAVIKLLTVMIFPFALLQLILDRISEYIIRGDFLDNARR
ncbi:MAG: hypothetical protein WCO44_03255 [Bacteroidota bacterium]